MRWPRVYDRSMSKRARREAAIERALAQSAAGDELRCLLCGHEYERRELTKHHFVPKSRGGRETGLLCRPCHAQVHALYTEKELEAEFGTIEQLREAPKLQSWMRFIRRRKPSAKIKVKTSRKKGR